MSNSKNRIWPEGEGLTWSTITNLLGEDESTETRLQKCTLDLTDTLFLEVKNLKELEAQIEKSKEKIKFLNSNLANCIKFGKKRLNYSGKIKYIHDVEAKTVSVQLLAGQIEVTEEKLTFIASS